MGYNERRRVVADKGKGKAPTDEPEVPPVQTGRMLSCHGFNVRPMRDRDGNDFMRVEPSPELPLPQVGPSGVKECTRSKGRRRASGNKKREHATDSVAHGPDKGNGGKQKARQRKLGPKAKGGIKAKCDSLLDAAAQLRAGHSPAAPPPPSVDVVPELVETGSDDESEGEELAEPRGENFEGLQIDWTDMTYTPQEIGTTFATCLIASLAVYRRTWFSGLVSAVGALGSAAYAYWLSTRRTGYMFRDLGQAVGLAVDKRSPLNAMQDAKVASQYRDFQITRLQQTHWPWAGYDMRVVPVNVSLVATLAGAAALTAQPTESVLRSVEPTIRRTHCVQDTMDCEFQQIHGNHYFSDSHLGATLLVEAMVATGRRSARSRYEEVVGGGNELAVSQYLTGRWLTATGPLTTQSTWASVLRRGSILYFGMPLLLVGLSRTRYLSTLLGQPDHTLTLMMHTLKLLALKSVFVVNRLRQIHWYCLDSIVS